MAELMDDERAFEVVSEALRAGPGSPAWREALGMVGGEWGDEVAVLQEMRERLASGRKYRELRPGAGFTRKVMDAVEREAEEGGRGGQPSGFPVASVVIVLSAAAILVVVGIVGYLIKPSGKKIAPPKELAAMIFSEPIAKGVFTEAISEDWITLGTAPVVSAQGLQAASAGGGGGIVSRTTLTANQAVAIEAKVRAPRESGGEGGGGIIQLFVTNDKDVNASGRSGLPEFDCVIQAGRVKVVLPDGRVLAERAAPDGTFNLRLAMNSESAMVTMEGSPLWTGENMLMPNTPRRIGVRFLGGASDGAVQEVRVMGGR